MAEGLTSLGGAESPGHKRIALLPWGNVIEDFLEGIGLTLDQFCERMSGGWLFGYAQALRMAGWDPVMVCVSRDAPAPLRRHHAPSGMPLWVLPAWRTYTALARRMKNPHGWTVEGAFGWTPWFRLPDRWIRKELAPYFATPLGALASVLREEGCRALLVQEYEQGRFDMCVLLGRWLRLPVLATFQGGDRHAGWLEALTRPVALRAASGLAVAAKAEAKRVVARYRVAPERIWRVYNPIDLDVWRPVPRAEARRALGIPAETHVVIWHGRIERYRKGLDVLLDAWERVQARADRPDARLLMLGSGADDDWLRDRLCTMPDSSIDWVDRYELDRGRMRQCLSAADIYALPSRVEGLPVALLEAMACGLSVVASEIPAVSEIFEQGDASGAILVPPDSADQFAAALELLLRDAGVRSKLADAARRTVEERFSLAAVSAQLGHMLTGATNDRVAAADGRAAATSA